jgi:5'-3' exonuclease
LEVVLSDSSVPGEGEHKMMDYIRQAKTHQGYDPNTRHCFYGADADLIMLSLLTHEPNFMIIREEHVIKKTKQGGVQRLDIQKTFNFQLIFISLLREYFQLEYSSLATQMRMRFDLERVIDDFVFFCFFIGNDFLPSLSALDISEGSLDSLIDLYKELLPSMTDYITEAGKIYWDRAQPFIEMLGKHEVDSFRLRIESIKQAKYERIVSFQGAGSSAVSVAEGGAGQDSGNAKGRGVDRATMIKNRIREKLHEKKVMKVLHLKNKKKDRQYKKFMLIKRFQEDDEEGSMGLSKHQKEIRAQMLTKFSALFMKQ